MKEYKLIHVERYSPTVEQLNEQSRQGWDVVAICSSNSDITIYLMAREVVMSMMTCTVKA
jgi:hypothetical protein